MSKSQRGSAQVLGLFGLLIAGGLVISSQIPITRQHQSNVAGVNTSIGATNPGKLMIITDSGKPAVVHKLSGAVSTFPLTINKSTNALIVTTPSGEKTVTILPDQAINNLLASRVMTDVSSVEAEGELASVNQVVELVEVDGALVYKVQGQRVHKLLGFIPIKSAVTATVSADSGEVLTSEQSLLGRILNRIAPESL